jgi:hypothetical protein
MALGAGKRDILGRMLRESTRPVLAGLLAGRVLAVGAPPLLRGVLYGLSIVDGISFARLNIVSRHSVGCCFICLRGEP